jgi:hypothetical protein
MAGFPEWGRGGASRVEDTAPRGQPQEWNHGAWRAGGPGDAIGGVARPVIPTPNPGAAPSVVQVTGVNDIVRTLYVADGAPGSTSSWATRTPTA